MRRSYAAAGSFVGFLLHEYGAGRFREAYWTNDVASSYDKSLPQLDEEWRSFLAQVPFTPQAKERAAVRYDPAVNVPFYRTACPRVGSLDAVARLRFRGWEAWRSGLPSTAEQDLCRVALLDPAHFGHELLVFSRQRLFLHSDPVGLQGLELLAKRPGWLGREALLSLYRWGKETGSKELQEGSLEELVERGYLERALAAQLSPAPAGSGWESSEGGSGAPRVPELIRLLHPEFQFESREISLAERREATERLARETGFAEARIRALLRLSEMEFVQGDVAAARVRLESILPQLAGTRREARWRQRLARWRFVEQSLAAGDPPGASNTVTSGREADRARL